MATLAPPMEVSPAPSASSATTTAGRPSMWTKSAQRKMARLYVYTTLPLNKIVKIIHSESPESAPGYESAHKKLNVLLDKEPRWLHPRRLSDMHRRVSELANSPTRLRSATDAALHRSCSTSYASGVLYPAEGMKMGGNLGHVSLHMSTEYSWTSKVDGEHPEYRQGVSSLRHERSDHITESMIDGKRGHDEQDQQMFSAFLRRTTCLSNATSKTTGSFHRLLTDYSEPYVQTVKRLVRKFTAPVNAQASLQQTSDDHVIKKETWANERDCPPNFSKRPFPIPGDFLNVDNYLDEKSCHFTSESHAKRSCLCYMSLDACVLPWVTRDGITDSGHHLLTHGLMQHDVSVMDSFGNTALHFLAARGSIDLLCHSLQLQICRPLLMAKNTAGQTFIHVVNPGILRSPDSLRALLHILRLVGCDFNCRDNYGRTLFHLLKAEKHSRQHTQQFEAAYVRDISVARDAFGFSLGSSRVMAELEQHIQAFRKPTIRNQTKSPGVGEESRLLENIRLAETNPLLEDSEGRNGLHCLAMATLSSASVAKKHHLSSSHQEMAIKKRHISHSGLDSSTDRLQLRLGLLTMLLSAGVDPNQHDYNGNTPLMAFVAELPEDDDYKSPPKILEFLIHSGANINARNRRGETALHIAVRRGKKLAMRTLCNEGANVHVRDSAGRSLLDVLDMKMMQCESDESVQEYAHFEACRAWLSGKAMALQSPGLVDEWGYFSDAY